MNRDIFLSSSNGCMTSLTSTSIIERKENLVPELRPTHDPPAGFTFKGTRSQTKKHQQYLHCWAMSRAARYKYHHVISMAN